MNAHDNNAECWSPRYVITPAVARDLMVIEAARVAVAHAPLR